MPTYRTAALAFCAAAIVIACATLGKEATKLDPTAALLEARKVCTIYGMGGAPRDPALDEMCEAVLTGCSEGAGGAAQ